MTKTELIDAVKRWQVAQFLTYYDRWPVVLVGCHYLDSFPSATKTFLALLEQLEPDTIKMLVVKAGEPFPTDFSMFPKVTLQPLTEPGIGFPGGM